MPTVTLSDTTFEGLKSLAEPFVDTPESVIARLTQEEVSRRGATGNGKGSSSEEKPLLSLNADTHESLAFTRLISASLDGREIYRPKWNTILVEIHMLARKRLDSFNELAQATQARIREGRYEEDGYKYFPEGDFSIQGVDANLAWRYSLNLARQVSMPIRITFEWRNKEAAAHPGRKGVLEWIPARA